MRDAEECCVCCSPTFISFLHLVCMFYLELSCRICSIWKLGHRWLCSGVFAASAVENKVSFVGGAGCFVPFGKCLLNNLVMLWFTVAVKNNARKITAILQRLQKVFGYFIFLFLLIINHDQQNLLFGWKILSQSKLISTKYLQLHIKIKICNMK